MELQRELASNASGASEPPMPLFRRWNDISRLLNYQSAGFLAKTRSGAYSAKNQE